MIGTTLSHFRIIAKLGEGGMGEVYRAEDTKLGREVAIKVLPEEMASDPDRLERFQREARAVAALNHPNIAAIYSFDSAEREGASPSPTSEDTRLSGDPPSPQVPTPPGPSIHFLVMELVEGKTLDALVPSTGLTLERFFELATPIADAVASAHGRGIVHRDLKPTNVMVTDEGQRVKVLDFGLAKLTEASTPDGLTEMPTEALTQEGIVVGTPHYMSPEQAKGEAVDQRSDIFSLGVMLFEMATGGRPFHGASSIELLSSVLKDSPPTVTDVKPDLPRHLGRVIGRCLEKAPVDRYQTARDVFNELKALTKETSGDSIVSPAASHRPSRDRGVAVLPFRAPSSDADLTTLAEGLSEDVTTGLARFPHFFVVDGTAAGLSDSSTDTVSVQGIRYLLKGGLRSAGRMLRVNIQLVDAQTGSHLWAETYDQNLDDANIFEIQDRLTDRIVGAVADGAGVLARSLATEIRSVPDDELTADEWMFRAFAHMQQLEPDEHAQLREGLEAVTSQQPDHADAWGWLSMLYLQEHQHQLNPLPDSLPRALAAAQRSVGLDPACQVGRVHLASVYFHQRDLGAFLPAAERAIALNPRDTHFVGVMGMMIAFSGEWDRGLEIVRKAMELNPHHPGWLHFVPFYVHFQQGDYEEALRVAKLIQMPEFQWTWYVIGAAAGQLGRTTEAREAVERLKELGIETLEQARTEEAKWIYEDRLLDDLLEGLRKAGLGEDSSRAAPNSMAGDSNSAPPTSAISQLTQTGRSLAVLPFVNRSGTADDDYFSDGLTEELINALSKLPGLRVTARSSAFQFRGRELDVREVGQKLDVEVVLEGSVRIAGNRLRITTELVNCADGYKLWAERFDGEMKDIFDTQDEIAQAIVEQLQVELGGRAEEPLIHRGTENLEAYHLLLKARHHMIDFWEPGFVAAHECLEQAIELDPEYAEAYAVMSENYMLRSIFGSLPGSEAFPLVRSTAQRALELDPDLGEAHKGLSIYLGWHDFDWDNALAEARLGIEKSPQSVWSHFYHAGILATMRRGDEMVEAFLPALELDPLNPIIAAHYSLMLFYAGRNDEAEIEARKALELFPDYWFHYYMLSYVFWKRRDADSAIANMEKANELTGGDVPWLNCALSAMSFTFGRTEDAERCLVKVEKLSESTYVTPMGRAVIEIARGNTDEAIAWLERAHAEHDTLFAWTRAFCEQQGIIADERIRETMERLGLP